MLKKTSNHKRVASMDVNWCAPTTATTLHNAEPKRVFHKDDQIVQEALEHKIIPKQKLIPAYKTKRRVEFKIEDFIHPQLEFPKNRPTLRVFVISFHNAQLYVDWRKRYEKLVQEINEYKPDIIGIYDMKIGETLLSFEPLRYFLQRISLPYQGVFQPEIQSSSILSFSKETSGCMVLSRYKFYEIMNMKLSKTKNDELNCMCLVTRLLTDQGFIDFGVANISCEFNIQQKNLSEIKSLYNNALKKGSRGQILVGEFSFLLDDITQGFKKQNENDTNGFLDIISTRSVEIGGKEIPLWDIHRKVYYRGQMIRSIRDDLEHEAMLERKENGDLQDDDKAYCLAEFQIEDSAIIKQIAFYLFEEGCRDAELIRMIGFTQNNKAQKENTAVFDILKATNLKSIRVIENELTRNIASGIDIIDAWEESIKVAHELEINEKLLDLSCGSLYYLPSLRKDDFKDKCCVFELKGYCFFKDRFLTNKMR